MTDTPKEKYDTQKQALWGRENTYECDGYVPTGEMSERDANLIEELCDAFDGSKPDQERHLDRKARFPADKRKDRAISTLWSWMYQLTRMSRDLRSMDGYPDGLYAATAEDINNLLEEGYHGGQAPSTEGMAKSTTQTYQFKARIFYRFYADECGVAPVDITTYSSKQPSVEPEDMLSPEEIDALTQAAEHPRDLMIFHLLLYTGLRSSAARTLRVGDINLQEATYRLNDDMNGEGLKGANKRNEPRPLLFAQGAVQTWLAEFHPCQNDPMSYLITAKQEAKQDPHNVVGHNLLRSVLHKLKREASIEKPLYPHMLRHNFVTICKADYGLDNDTIKYLIGHEPDSQVMERTYSHLSGEEYLQNARRGFNMDDVEERTSRLTPKTCVCGTNVEPGSKACYSCGVMFTPDARHIQTKIADAIDSGTN